jgi:protein O-GlcNAc transferase
LENHDAERFEIFCYSESLHPDELTEKLQSHAHVWREIMSLSDEQLAKQIADDRIDILVDLAMHLRRNRLLCFARKPAPIQATHLAYPGTTGLSAIDYHFTDADLDPPGVNDDYYVEKPAYLKSYWCYQPLEFAPPVGDLPALSKGHVTFGALNSFNKVSDIALETWVRILQRVPDARLILYAPEGEPREHVRKQLAERVDFLGFASTAAYLRAYRHIDIALDSMPIVGGTTTCDALWGGTPVVTIPGKTAITRSGVSILNNADCPEWIASSIDQYVDIAVGLASDLPALARIRATLRDRMKQSRLMDAVAGTRDIESAYQKMWSVWVNSPAVAPGSNV